MAMKSEKGDELSPILPYNLMINILSRLSVKSIVRFKCVSKSWLTVFTHPHFVSIHYSRSRNIKLVLTNNSLDPDPLRALFDSLNINPTRSLFVSSCRSVEAASDDGEGEGEGEGVAIDIFKRFEQKEQVSIAGSCRGLVLCSTRHGTLYLVNPSTREVIRLPDSPFRKSVFASHALGYDPSLDDYKVVQISSPYPSSSAEVITSLYSVKSNSWKKIQDFPFLVAVSNSGLFLNGNLHWFNSDRTKMASLSLAEEKFGDVPLPDDDDNNILGGGGGGGGRRPPFNSCFIGVVKGCLCIIPPDGPGITFWMMKEYGRRDSWTKFEFAVPFSVRKPLDFSNNDENLFEIGSNKFVMYNLKERTYRYLKFHNAPPIWRQAETFSESVVSPIFLQYGLETLPKRKKKRLKVNKI